ncbi:MAG: hypothetical protein QXF59_02145 [Candidatus Bathyarchaeia archaeon]
MEEEEKKLKVSIDFGSSFKFWIAFLIVQIIAVIIAMVVVLGLIGLMMPMLQRYLPTSLAVLAQNILNIPF